MIATASPSPPAIVKPAATIRPAAPTFSQKTPAITVQAGRTFRVELPLNQGTGYSWRPAAPLPPGLTVLSTFAAPHGPAIPGGPANQLFVLREKDVGVIHLKFEYVRPWEHGVKPAKTSTFTITARP